MNNVSFITSLSVFVVFLNVIFYFSELYIFFLLKRFRFEISVLSVLFFVTVVFSLGSLLLENALFGVISILSAFILCKAHFDFFRRVKGFIFVKKNNFVKNE